MKKLIIFDMDGVLTDTEPATIYACMESLERWNVKAQYDDFKPYTGMGDDIFIGKVAEKYGAEYNLEMKALAYEIYCEKAAQRVHVFNWSKPLILKLKEAGYTLAVASASDFKKVNCNIECIGAANSTFAAIITGSDVKNKKPAPDIFLKAAEKAGFNTKDAVVIEDAISGVKAAKASGAQCIAITTSFSRDQLKEAGADYIVDDLSDAFDIIKMILPVN